MHRILLCILVSFGCLEALPVVFQEKKDGPDSPHFEAQRCGDCHGRELSEAKDFGGLKRYYDRQCRTCHDRSAVVCTFHADRLILGETLKLLPPSFPLLEERITCLTCHDARIQCGAGGEQAMPDRRQGNRRFLRGSPRGGSARFCFACHQPERYKRYKVHGQMGEGTRTAGPQCRYCHDGQPPALKPVKVCRACHEVGDHPGEANHLISLDTLGDQAPSCRQSGDGKAWIPVQGNDLSVKLPLGAGMTLMCHTCHDPHGFDLPGRFLLRTRDRSAICRGCHGAAFV